MIFNYSTIVDPLLRDVRIFIPDFSEMKKGDRVLDVCSGTGDQTFYYAKKGIFAFGIDKRIEMIKTAEKRKKELGVKNSFFKLADAKNLPFKDGYFDFASICLGLHEMRRSDRSEVISEMKRVVKKQGSLILVDFQVPFPKNLVSFILYAVEYFAGKENFECFSDYLKQGGLQTLIKLNDLISEKEDCFKSGLIKTIKVKNHA